MKPTLAQYLAEYIVRRVTTESSIGRVVEWMEGGIVAYESTEGVTVSVVRADKEMHEECKSWWGVWKGCINKVCNFRLEKKGKEADMAPADKDGVRTLGLLNECIQAKATLESIQRSMPKLGEMQRLIETRIKCLTETRIHTLEQTIDKAHRCHIDSSDQRVAPVDGSAVVEKAKGVKSPEEGICPKCGWGHLNYLAMEVEGVGLYYPYTCEACGFVGVEWYDVTFAGHWDTDGNEIEEQGVVVNGDDTSDNS